MAQSSDALIKQEIITRLGFEVNDAVLRIFPEGSNDDQILVEDGGLTFSHDGVNYGSCDAGWFVNDDNTGEEIPFIGLEGTDALNRGTTGNAQYQRFHHALGAVKRGLIGIYYLRPGKCEIQPDLYGMAYNASQVETGTYLIINDLKIVEDILRLRKSPVELDDYLKAYLERMRRIFHEAFIRKYQNWNTFAAKRSTLTKGEFVIKHAARMVRNFTDGSQRAGHIAVGEMYLTKYYFPEHYFLYFFPKMTQSDLDFLDKTKSSDKEWHLLRNEERVSIITLDNIKGIPNTIREDFLRIKDEPSKGEALTLYNRHIKSIMGKLKEGTYQVEYNYQLI
jgi:hypothetical protein